MARVDEVVAAGADILDIGGVKAGPGDLVDAAEQVGVGERLADARPDELAPRLVEQ